MTCMIGKTIETLLKNKINKIILNTQNPFMEKVSPIYASLLIQKLHNEALAKLRQTTVQYVAFLVFDVVDITSLMRKLFMYGICGTSWPLTHVGSLHKDVSSQVKWIGQLSDDFPVLQGVREGGILSTLRSSITSNTT